MAQRTVMLLEQNQKIAYTMEAAASRSVYRFLSMPWGEDIVQLLEKHPVDVILLNVKQIGVSPRALIVKIREDARFKVFPLILIYGKPGKESKAELMKLGADDFIPMPFTPAELITIVDGRMRPLASMTRPESAGGTGTPREAGIEKARLQPMPPKGDLESIPLCSMFARIHTYHDSGLLHLILKKETRTLYFETGHLIFAQSASRRDDLGDFMARHGAGTGSGRELIAARNQVGGPGCDPREFRLILSEVNLMDAKLFSWWSNMYVIDLIRTLFSVTNGAFQWQTLPLPDFAKEMALPFIPLSRLIFEGVRAMPKWWHSRELLPHDDSIPALDTDYESSISDLELTPREQLAISSINGQRSLRTIREICHQSFPCIDNYIYGLQQLSLLGFDTRERGAHGRPEIVDMHARIDEEESVEPTQVETVPENGQTGEDLQETLASADLDVLIPPRKETPVPDPVPEPAAAPSPPVKSFRISTGSLADVPATELFRECLEHEVSGSLEFTNLGITKTVYWKRGKILTVTSDDIDERLDNFLFRKHMLSQEQRDDLRTAHPDQIGSPNELLRRRYLSLEQVFSVVKEHAEILIDDILAWQAGTFDFRTDRQPPKDMVPLDLTPAAMIMTGLRKLQQWNHIERFLPADNDVMRLPERTANRQSGLNLSHIELRILNVLTDPLTMTEIVRRIGIDPVQIRQSIYAMECAGLVARMGRMN